MGPIRAKEGQVSKKHPVAKSKIERQLDLTQDVTDTVGLKMLKILGSPRQASINLARRLALIQESLKPFFEAVPDVAAVAFNIASQDDKNPHGQQHFPVIGAHWFHYFTKPERQHADLLKDQDFTYHAFHLERSDGAITIAQYCLYECLDSVGKSSALLATRQTLYWVSEIGVLHGWTFELANYHKNPITQLLTPGSSAHERIAAEPAFAQALPEIKKSIILAGGQQD